jgi:sterol desaturase/sphingolipid hydroxylase (fatty acid hydroxylase superfamily)
MPESTWGVRDNHGEWQPDELPKPSPLFSLPLKPKAILAYLFAPGGLLFPFNLFLLGLAVVSGLYLTPGSERTARFAFGWIALIYVRNAVLMILLFGAFHYWLYIRRAQGTKYKYSDKWLAVGDKRFLFGNQTWDNIFYSLVSGCGIWTAYEALTLWAFANRLIPAVDWQTHPVYCTLLLVAVVFLREFHFYWVHRLTHWRPLYRPVHALHHLNINVGPWSGMAMHPLEHLLYLSGVLLHWVIPSHPIHAIAHLMHAGLAPVKGHSGFNKFILGGFGEAERERTLGAGNYLHYLHHRFFTVNYGNDVFPFDRWYGSCHDGSPEMHAAMLERRKRNSHRITSGDRKDPPAFPGS